MRSGRTQSRVLSETVFRYFSIACGLAIPLAAATQDTEPPGVLRTEPAGQEQALPRGATLERRFVETEDWVFYHEVADIPDDLRTVLFKITGPSIVDAGESFDDGDVIVYRRAMQHLFTAQGADIAVFVWYAGSFSGPRLHALVYDSTARDGCRYDFSTAHGAVSLQPALKRLIRDKQSADAACHYLASL
jgi:hypothetical protein